MNDVPCLLRADEIAALPEKRNVHQFDDGAVRHARELGTRLGLERIGLHLVRLEPGRASTTFHYHEADEEFLYVLSGTGVAEIGEHRVTVGAGDLMAFGAPSPAHRLLNEGTEDLVYLMGGERNETDVVRYPRDGWTLVKAGGRRQAVRSADLEDL